MVEVAAVRSGDARSSRIRPSGPVLRGPLAVPDRTEFAEFADVTSWFRTRLQRGDGFGETSLALVSLLANRAQWVHLLRSFICDAQAVAAVADQCYFHTNGFERIVLVNDRDFRIRCHIWSEDKRSEFGEGVHNHTWDFASLVVAGTLVTELYAPDPSQDESFYYYRSVHDGRRYQYDFVQRTGLRKTLEIEMPAGTRYRLSHDILHRVVAPTGDAATVVVTGSFVTTGSDVYTHAPIDHSRQEYVATHDPDELCALLHDHIAALTSNQSMAQ
jgi:hypothetical protein